MTWGVVVALAAGTAVQRLVGMFGLGTLLVQRPVLRRIAELLPAAIVAAVVVQVAFTRSGELDIDARVVGMGVAGLLVWRRAPLIVVVIAAAVTTALVRLA